MALAGTHSTILNRSGENKHHCLFPDLKGKAFNLLPLSLVLAVNTFFVDICNR